MQKLTLGMGFDGEGPTYELCVKEGRAEHCHVMVVAEMLGMEIGNLEEVQNAINTINQYVNVKEED
ncbi:hypothetical protein CMI37_16970 [Candidatus Pacearchaeota archaeon]|nr:hypothetical protein [Candidatus Pacearchaeota archaeon]|tara:strand:- start:612 stop:809 length:198 start_codon:yes stop_codon:yes gene_type:complete